MTAMILDTPIERPAVLSKPIIVLIHFGAEESLWGCNRCSLISRYVPLTTCLYLAGSPYLGTSARPSILRELIVPLVYVTDISPLANFHGEYGETIHRGIIQPDYPPVPGCLTLPEVNLVLHGQMIGDASA